MRRCRSIAPQTPSQVLLRPMFVEAKASSPRSAGVQPPSLPTWIFVFPQRPPQPVWRKRCVHLDLWRNIARHFKVRRRLSIFDHGRRSDAQWRFRHIREIDSLYLLSGGGFCLRLLLWGTAGNWRQSKTGATARRSAGVGRLAGPGVDCPTEVASVARKRVAANEVAIAKE